MWGLSGGAGQCGMADEVAGGGRDGAWLLCAWQAVKDLQRAWQHRMCVGNIHVYADVAPGRLRTVCFCQCGYLPLWTGRGSELPHSTHLSSGSTHRLKAYKLLV
jgi:hypothetical protein